MKRKGNKTITVETLLEGEAKVDNILVAMLAELLHIEEKELDVNTDLRDFGLDSVALNEFTDMINKRLDTQIDSTLLFEYTTMKEIGNYLQQEYVNQNHKKRNEAEKNQKFEQNLFEQETLKLDSDVGINLVEILISMLASLLRIEESELDELTDLRDFGLDSVALNELTEMINQRLDVDIDASLLFEYSNMKEIGTYLSEEYIQLGKKYEKSIPEFKSKTIDTPKEKIESKSEPIRELSGLFTESLNVEHNVVESKGDTSEDIAIIGMSGRLPQSDNLKEFWDHLVNQEDLVTEIPEDRFDWREYYGDSRKGNKVNNKWGGFLKDIRGFDAQFFNISPREAELMDPQQRILLEEVWRLFEDAGYKASSVAGSNTGVFVGVCNDDYNELISNSGIDLDSYAATGAYFCIIANRISYLLNLQGPSSAVDTACSSSLVAIHQGVTALRNGECEMAVAGGINIICIPRPYLSFSHAGMLSKDGRCKSFDMEANGYVRAEGAGAILLKPLHKAIEDGNQIYGVIKGTAVNHCGLTNSLTAPSPNAQAKAIATALEKGKIDPSTVTYIEAHGTGTSLGDPIEINGLKKAFEEAAKSKGIPLKEKYCGIGSVKSNIGHLEVASGIAGVFKVLLSMKHKFIPGNLHFNKINEFIHLEGSPFYVVDSNKPWEVLVDDHGNQIPRRAGISSFGFGGTNAHIVIEEYQAMEKPMDQSLTFPEVMIILSAKTEERLKVYTKDLLNYLRQEEITDNLLPDMAYTLQNGREAMQERLAILTNSIQDLIEKMELFLEGKTGNKTIFYGNVKTHKKTISIFEGDQEFGETLTNWAKKGKYGKILDLWVKGLYFDWKILYGKDKPRIISLPTYPFKKEYYWIPQTPNHKEDTKGSKLAVLHPLLHENISDFNEQKYRTVLSGNEFFLKAHVIDNQKILPGVAYLEMALAAVKAAADCDSDNTIFQLNNIIWSKPVVVKDNPVELKITLYLESDEQISYQIYGEDSSIHSEGIATIKLEEEITTIDIGAKQRACCEEELSGNECYGAFEQIGFNYGAEQRGIEKLYIGKNQILAKIHLPEEVKGTSNEYALHPSILDSAIQATMGLMREKNKMTAFVPLALHNLTVTDQNPDLEWAYIKTVNVDNSRNNLRKFDIDLCNSIGKVCVQMKGLTLKKLENKLDKKVPDKKSFAELILLTPEWKETHFSKEETHKYDNHLCILCEVPGISLSQLNEAFIKDTEGFRCMELEEMSEDIGVRYQKYTVQVFEEIKKILAEKTSKKTLVQIMISNSDEERLYAGLSGLLKTAEQENPKIIGQLIEIGQGETTADLTRKMIENKKRTTEKQITYLDGKRYVKGWRELPEILLNNKPWRDGGKYLITGGSGELGLIFAREIAKEAKNPTLILTGRGNLNPEKQKSLEEIKKLGANIVYKKLNVTDAKLVQDLMEEVKREYGVIHGILHCAGINRDNYIYKKNKEEVQLVLEPKVSGLLNLDKASKDIPLDFFILFSSIAGSLGNPGQADYAAANAFMDEYARYREVLVKSGSRHGKTVSINWPLWKNGGMHMGEETKKMHVMRTGMEELQTAKGLEAFYKVYAQGLEQIMVVTGDREKIREFVTIKTEGRN